MADARIVTPDELAGMLSTYTRTTTAAVIGRTIPRMRKRNNDVTYDAATKTFDIVRIRHSTVMLNTDYARGVNAMRRREHAAADFESSGRTWGQHQRVGVKSGRPGNGVVSKRTALVTFGDSRYLNCRRINTLQLEYRRLSTNAIVPAEVVAPWLIESTSAKTAARQGVTRPVLWRDYQIGSIAALSLDGVQYVVRPMPNPSTEADA